LKFLIGFGKNLATTRVLARMRPAASAFFGSNEHVRLAAVVAASRADRDRGAGPGAAVVVRPKAAMICTHPVA